MIEGLAILLVVAVSLAIYLFAWAGARNFARQNPSSELEHLRYHREVLQQKIYRGKLQHWDQVMMAHLAAKLAEVDRQIVEKTASAPHRSD